MATPVGEGKSRPGHRTSPSASAAMGMSGTFPARPNTPDSVKGVTVRAQAGQRTTRNFSRPNTYYKAEGESWKSELASPRRPSEGSDDGSKFYSPENSPDMNRNDQYRRQLFAGARSQSDTGTGGGLVGSLKGVDDRGRPIQQPMAINQQQTSRQAQGAGDFNAAWSFPDASNASAHAKRPSAGAAAAPVTASPRPRDLAAPSGTAAGTTDSPVKRQKLCKKCGLAISGQFVRALNAAYHIECFTCNECNVQCSSKFFPIDDNEGGQVPLCERCYFKRLDLLCYACDGALRGSYITALGRKYHVNHFTCSMCSTVFGPDDSYYEHDNQIFCHYHYSTLHAARCEGCQTAILKQFVEIYRGGREQQWHPECYMIFKFWNVKLCPSGVPALPSEAEKRRTRDEVMAYEKKIDQTVYRIWTGLCGYEEGTASHISDMLQNASNGKYHQAGKATALLVSKIEVLYRAIDDLDALIQPLLEAKRGSDETDGRRGSEGGTGGENVDDKVGSDDFTRLGKEPKTLCKKLVGFMSLISRPREGSKRLELSQELLSLVTSLAHYLKILIRHGLSNALRYDRKVQGGRALEVFLKRIETHQLVGKTLQSRWDYVTYTTGDACMACNLSVEDRSVHYEDRVWHVKCFHCSNCERFLGDRADSALCHPREVRVFCSECAPPAAKPGFFVATRLEQFMFLLKIAILRFQHALNMTQGAAHETSQTSPPAAGDERPPPAITTSAASASPSSEAIASNEKGYMTTLTDIRRLRSAKLDKRVSKTPRKARRSRILDMPDSEAGQVKNDSQSLVDANRKSTSDTTLAVPANGHHNDNGTPGVPPYGEKPYSSEGSTVSLRTFSTKRKKELRIEDLNVTEDAGSDRLDRTTDLLKNEKSLTLDDIPRIVAAEQAREQMPNAFKHQKRLVSGANAIPVSQNVAAKKDEPRKYMSELTPAEQFVASNIAVILVHRMMPGSQYSREELFDLVEQRKAPSLWGKFGKAFGAGSGGSSQSAAVDKAVKSKKKINVFGTPLEVLVARFGVDSTLGIGPSPLRIPQFVDDCISSMRQKDMSVEGIFRKNGNIRRLKEFTDRIDKNPEEGGLLAEENPIQLAALLKKFLREMPEPLMTFKLQKLWVAAQRKFFFFFFFLLFLN